MRVRALLLSIVVMGGTTVGLTAGLASPALADTTKITYAVDGLDAHPGRVFVAWPRACGSDGAPLGTVSLELNPEWKQRQHEIDYEVVEKGVRHEVSPFCVATMRIHALDAAAFPRGSKVATADDVALGHEVGKPFAILPALDALELSKDRVPFLTSDPKQQTLAFRFDLPPASAPDARAAKAIHYDLALDSTLALRAKRAIYTYLDGPPETVDLSSASASPRASASASAPEGTTPAPAAPSDGGTRWVYAAAILGLVAGGLMAHFRKKKPDASS